MRGRVFTDTTNFLAIDYGDQILIGGKLYEIRGHEREERFGMSEPKFWVKKAVDSDTGERKIIKLAFLESFEITLGGVKIHRFRSPEKESRVLEAVRGHPNFMQGEAFEDSEGNNVRVLDVVSGKAFYSYVNSLSMEHEDYFDTELPGILERLVASFDAVRFLHSHGLRHGDIRNDHILIEEETGHYVWIDFDYEFEATENPFGLDVFGLGNILLFAAGMGFHELNRIKTETSTYRHLADDLEEEDFSILSKWRFTNLRKLYPYVPKALNDILLHFSKGTDVFYENAEEVIEDLSRCLHLEFS